MAYSPFGQCFHSALNLRHQEAEDDLIELLHPVLAGKDLLPQLPPVQGPVTLENTGELFIDGVAQLLVFGQHLMVSRIAVDHLAAQLLNGPQGAGLSRTRTAGNAQHHPLAVRLHHMEAGSLLEAVADGKASPRLSGHCV